MPNSSLIPERQLVFSPALASTIGLEEAVLLQHLGEFFEHHEPQIQNGFAWLSIERGQLERALPFWSPIDLHRISRALVDKGVLLDGLTEECVTAGCEVRCGSKWIFRNQSYLFKHTINWV